MTQHKFGKSEDGRRTTVRDDSVNGDTATGQVSVDNGSATLEMPDGTPVTLQPGWLARAADRTATVAAWIVVVGVFGLIVGGSLAAKLDAALLVVGIGIWGGIAFPLWAATRQLARQGLRAAFTGHGMFRVVSAISLVTALAVAMLSGSMAVWAIMLTGVVAFLAVDRILGRGSDGE